MKSDCVLGTLRSPTFARAKALCGGVERGALHGPADDKRSFVFKRSAEGVSAIVAVNPGRETEIIELPAGDGSDARTITLEVGEPAFDGTTLTLPPHERDARHQQHRRIGELDFARAQARRHARGVVIARDQVEIAVRALGFAQARLVFGEERADARAAVWRYRDLPTHEGAYTRTGSRTPMQWDASVNAGFSSASANALYLPVDGAKDAPTVSRRRGSYSARNGRMLAPLSALK